MKHLVALLLAASALTAHAQVYKCAGSNGQAVYSDKPCGTVTKRLIERDLRPNSLPAPAVEYHSIPAAQSRPAPVAEEQAMPTCPPDVDIRNWETSLSSVTRPPPDAAQLRLKVRLGRACQRGPAALLAEQKAIQAEAATYQQQDAFRRALNNCTLNGVFLFCW